MRISKAIVIVIVIASIVSFFLHEKRQRKTIKTQKIEITDLSNELIFQKKKYVNLEIKHEADSILFTGRISELESGLASIEEDYFKLSDKFKQLKVNFENVKSTIRKKDRTIDGLTKQLEQARGQITSEQQKRDMEAERARESLSLATRKGDTLDLLRRDAAKSMAFILSSTYGYETSGAYTQIRHYIKSFSEKSLNSLYADDQFSKLRKIAQSQGLNPEDLYKFLIARGLSPLDISKSRLKAAIREFFAHDYEFMAKTLFGFSDEATERIKAISEFRFDLN